MRAARDWVVVVAVGCALITVDREPDGCTVIANDDVLLLGGSFRQLRNCRTRKWVITGHFFWVEIESRGRPRTVDGELGAMTAERWASRPGKGFARESTSMGTR